MTLVSRALPTPELSVEVQYNTYRVYCPLLVGLAPDPEQYFIRPEVWIVGPWTFEALVDIAARRVAADEDYREHLAKQIRRGCWDMSYDGTPIQYDSDAPEDRLWPA